MKKLLAVTSSLLIILLVCNCTGDDSQRNSTSGNLGRSVFLQKNESVHYSVSTEDIEIQITQINDSRCPQDVVCIWGGEVIVSFLIPTGETIELCLGGSTDCVSSSEFTFNGNTYQLILLDVKPYPTTTNGNEERVVEFTLVKVI